ncbi:helix-turn-helix domain-containing protein [Brucella gallinifaecis]|uniref:Helix-turn-helix domain-containing protein n=1 Tax=Brucella gallinifaecis TaxID=215590 RepID=A0A502BG05_9HYPH|nr:XRE family transcriptional regulator [Brucella gallinifaecis]TPF73862.1 helix-turn-helix domain-containing protein [Brucella gallinifaecis]
MTSTAPSNVNKPSIGEALRERRGYHGWTLADVAAKTGMSKSTLSKIENDLISPSYQSILQLCAGLGIEIGDLVSGSGAKGEEVRKLTGRRSISRDGTGLVMGDDNFTYTYVCTDIAHKRIIPMMIDVRARSINEVGGLWNHVGEEYLYVLEGSIELQTELYEPTILEKGDSAYFDSTMGHAYLSTGEFPAKLLVMCSSATPNLAQTLREVLSDRLGKRVKKNTT